VTRLELLAVLAVGAVLFVGGFGFLLAWALLHNVDRPARPDMTRLTVDEPFTTAAGEACALTRGCGADSCTCDVCVQADIAEGGCDCDDCRFWALAVAEKQHWGERP
jgi:hypothetical protein